MGDKHVSDSSAAGGGSGEEWEALNPSLDDAWKAVARRFMRDFQVRGEACGSCLPTGPGFLVSIEAMEVGFIWGPPAGVRR